MPVNRLFSIVLWTGVGAAALFALYTLAITRGESVNALWLVTAAICIYLIGFRFYATFIAKRVLRIDPARPTPAHVLNDGLDHVPTNKYVLFGHHFAAIAGAGPLVGPVLAAQMGYLPGALWLVIGVVFAGAVQDFLVLFISTRRDGRSLGDLIKSEMGEAARLVAMIGILAIMMILLAVLGLVVIKALADSPWGTFTVFATLPIAVLMGVYGRFLRPGRVGEMSLIGFALLMASLALGRVVAGSETLAPLFTFKGETLAFMLIAYGFVASVLPVWLLLAPRDYLSTFLKIGTILALAVGIFIVWPDLKMPAITRFVDGTGPVFAGSLFPFLFITIACGAVSGFHALVASGTTPKMIDNEAEIPFIGYGAMLMESCVAIMALIAASVVEPGVYFAMNSAPAVIGSTPEAAAQAISSWGFAVSAVDLQNIARDVGEKSVLSRTGGAPTLAVGMAHILASAVGGAGARAFWYHFAILFEALFILTTIDAGTRVARFMIQDFVGTFYPAFRRTSAWIPNLVATGVAVTGWGWFLHQGVVDPLGGINTLWPLFGIANQMLAAIALTLCSVVLFRMKRERYAFVAVAPAAWLYICTLTAGLEKIFHTDPRIGFLAHASRFSEALAKGEVLAPAKTLLEMQRILFNDYVDATLAAVLIALVLTMGAFGLRAMRAALRCENATTKETPHGLPELQPAEA
ncbi:carbon starvation CstA family protein [Methylocystis bryophila]|uniref:Carbon starvation protein A n=1 Tax=Methylocystis bryophila TaxID=655015 RepID=A0A1W6MS34_9HYPH|nr:carbon starvation CstA family protein [Methylocystis bryophila]ARN80377.1 carbon starvation protein A [Methylocystis bryophila]BDV40371.1 carbon starvation protein A [Methylocystis bryophila]